MPVVRQGAQASSAATDGKRDSRSCIDREDREIHDPLIVPVAFPRTRCAMNDEPTLDLKALSPEMLRALSAAAGVILSNDRVAALASQAAPHFAMLRAVDASADPSVEPAAQFRLDHAVGLSND
jgi:hypothetical protein